MILYVREHSRWVVTEIMLSEVTNLHSNYNAVWRMEFWTEFCVVSRSVFIHTKVCKWLVEDEQPRSEV